MYIFIFVNYIELKIYLCWYRLRKVSTLILQVYNLYIYYVSFSGQMFRSASSGQDNRDGRSLNDIGKDYGRQVIVRQLNISVWSFISGTFAVKVSPLRTPNSRSLTTTKMIYISWMNAVISVYPVHLLCSWVSRGGRKKNYYKTRRRSRMQMLSNTHMPCGLE